MLTQQRQRRNRRTKKNKRKQAQTKTPMPASLPGAGSLLAAAVAIAGGTQAYAEVIFFLNPDGPDHFDWTTPDPGQTRKWLDVTLDFASQPVGLGTAPSNFGQEPPYGYVKARPEGSVEAGGTYDLFLVGVASGELIPSGATWLGGAYAYYPGYEYSLIPKGEPTYLGVRFDPGDGFHYGWIGVVRIGTMLDAFAWGYETVPGVPIAAGIPVPGTLALLAFGAVPGLARSRKRKKV